MSKPTSPGTHLCAGETKSPGRLSCGQAHVRTDAILHRSTKPGRRDVAGAETRAQGRNFAQATTNPPGGCHVSKPAFPGTHLCAGDTKSPGRLSYKQARVPTDAILRRSTTSGRRDVAAAGMRAQGRIFAQATQNRPGGCHISKLTSVRTQFCTGAPNQAAAMSRAQKRGRRDAILHRRQQIPREVVM